MDEAGETSTRDKTSRPGAQGRGRRAQCGPCGRRALGRARKRTTTLHSSVGSQSSLDCHGRRIPLPLGFNELSLPSPPQSSDIIKQRAMGYGRALFARIQTKQAGIFLPRTMMDMDPRLYALLASIGCHAMHPAAIAK
jgi:hypothetical protein